MTMINIGLTLLTNIAVFGFSMGIFNEHMIELFPNTDSWNLNDNNYIPMYITIIIVLPFVFSLLSLLLFFHPYCAPYIKYGVLLPDDIDTHHVINESGDVEKLSVI